MTQSFGEMLTDVFAQRGHLCVGIDPHPYLLRDWGLADSAEGLREFGLRVIDAAASRAGIVKPQVAFYERHGSAGYAALEEVMVTARSAGLLVIADVKRGDVGTSVEAYGQAWLSSGSPLEADAMTISAYQGVGSLAAPMELAAASGKGLFVLAATSNPEARVIQTAVSEVRKGLGVSVAAGIVDGVNTSNVARWGARLGSFGLVVGATIEPADYGFTAESFGTSPVLAPGFGHQGAQLDSISTIYGAAAPNVIVSSSRAILDAGPEGIVRAIDAHVRELAAIPQLVAAL